MPDHTITARTVNAVFKLLIIGCSGCFSKGNLYYNFVFVLPFVRYIFSDGFIA